ncbi:metallopeptidase family protein [Aliiroseovarius subalbicans]|uniref:metallopeptidase family protein n=1 Tax=Aliiroseovarius subalbicans TaxID=2925840 RepID=UPI001F565D3D|nr:metallopeptidase family protein [Aliiroseovarius subalbicans]MCI2399358.1 metallopeptidase family protein [Aliiroseovarius subalbicans]
MDHLIAPSAADIEALAATTLAALPAPFGTLARDVVVHVRDLAPDDMLDDLDIDDPFGLTGLYDGIPMTQKSVLDQPQQPDTIWLFRRAILDEWAARGNVTLGALVSHIMVHELAHHFGWSDDDIAAIDRWWE